MAEIISASSVELTALNNREAIIGINVSCRLSSKSSLTASSFASPSVLFFNDSSIKCESTIGQYQLQAVEDYAQQLMLVETEYNTLSSQYVLTPTASLSTQMEAKLLEADALKNLIQSSGGTAGTTGSGIYGEFSIASYGSAYQGAVNEYTNLKSSIGASIKSTQNNAGVPMGFSGNNSGWNTGLTAACDV